MGETKRTETRPGERTFTYKGITKRLSGWARELKVHRSTIATRFEWGWTPEEIMETPIRKIAARYKKEEEKPVIVLNASVKL